MASILLDQNMPHGLRHLLTGHDVKTAYHLGWSDLVNGDLIAAAEAEGFDLMLTADRNIRYQQNLAGRRLAIVVVESSAWPLVRRNVDAIVEAVSRTRPGTFHSVSFRRPP